MSEPTSELRWHPLLRQWVAVAAARQNRPQLPEDWCPFCPRFGQAPEYDVYLYPNDFPAFSPRNPPFSPDAAEGFETEGFAATGARGACDVVLYSPDHNLLPSRMGAAQWEKVIGLWTRRTGELFANPDIAYVAIFENTGVAIGVTMPHPHGQIYAFPFVPPLAKTETDSARAHFENRRECLYCKILAGEIADGRRLAAWNASFVAFLPFFGRFPAEMAIYSRRHCSSLLDLSANERADLASLVSVVRQKYDNRYESLRPPFPLMMLARQRPAQGEHPYFHFHLDLLPIQRSAKKLKFLAAVESGTGTFLNDTVAEEEALQLRATEPRTQDA